MVALSAEKRQIVQSVIEAAPDSAVRSLELALSSVGAGDGLLNGVRALVEIEASDRAVRNVILSPIVALCQVREGAALSFPAQTKARLWRGLKAIEPALVADAIARANTWDRESPPPAPFDALCAAAARAIRERHPAFEALADGPDAHELLACLDLVPLVRAATMRLESWLINMTVERQAAARLAYKDAGKVAEDSGPRFFEMLSAQMAQPHLILRVISAVMDKPGERYLAASELAFFGDRALAGIQAQIERLSTFDPVTADNRSAGAAAGRAVSQVLNAIEGFEQAVTLSKDGRWGRSVRQHRQRLAKFAEQRLNGMDKLVLAALPLDSKVAKGRGWPRLDADPDPVAVERAAAALAFSDEIRLAAGHGGFGAARIKALETINERLDHYVEDILTSLRDEETVDRERRRAFLEAAAGLLGLSRDAKAEQIVRRRIAAA
jgi:hypothetical protein